MPPRSHGSSYINVIRRPRKKYPQLNVNENHCTTIRTRCLTSFRMRQGARSHVTAVSMTSDTDGADRQTLSTVYCQCFQRSLCRRFFGAATINRFRYYRYRYEIKTKLFGYKILPIDRVVNV